MAGKAPIYILYRDVSCPTCGWKFQTGNYMRKYCSVECALQGQDKERLSFVAPSRSDNPEMSNDAKGFALVMVWFGVPAILVLSLCFVFLLAWTAAELLSW